MDLKLIKKLLDLIAESEVNEVAIEEGDFKIKIKKQGEVEHITIPSQQFPAQFQPPVVSGSQQPQASPQPNAPSSVEQPSEEKKEIEGKVVKSPIVGTFYRSASPDTDAFVNVGDTIEKGQTLCIIEAMKIMNEIESEFSGEIKEILVEDSEPVEYDQPLFVVA